MSQFAKEYKQFFESPAGEDFIRVVNNIISSNHTKAENQPLMTVNYMQRAKGNREVLDHIASVTAERGKALSK